MDHKECIVLAHDKSGSKRVVDRKLATSPRGTHGSTQVGNTGKQSTSKHLLLRGNTRSRRQHTTRQRETDLSSRAVTNSLSGVSVTHDEYRTFTVVQVA